MTEHRELVLLDQMSGEAIGISAGGALGLGQQINFAVRLLERLAYLVNLEPVAPGLHLGDVAVQRMPQPYTSVVTKPVHLGVPLRHEPAVVPYAGRAARS